MFNFILTWHAKISNDKGDQLRHDDDYDCVRMMPLLLLYCWKLPMPLAHAHI